MWNCASNRRYCNVSYNWNKREELRYKNLMSPHILRGIDAPTLHHYSCTITLCSHRLECNVKAENYNESYSYSISRVVTMPFAVGGGDVGVRNRRKIWDREVRERMKQKGLVSRISREKEHNSLMHFVWSFTVSNTIIMQWLPFQIKCSWCS